MVVTKRPGSRKCGPRLWLALSHLGGSFPLLHRGTDLVWGILVPAQFWVAETLPPTPYTQGVLGLTKGPKPYLNQFLSKSTRKGF